LQYNVREKYDKSAHNFQQCSVSYVQYVAEIRGICPHLSPKELIGIQNRKLTLNFV